MNEHLQRNKQKYAEEDREYERQRHEQRHEAYFKPGGGWDREWADAEASALEMRRWRQRKELYEAITWPIVRTMWSIAILALVLQWWLR